MLNGINIEMGVYPRQRKHLRPCPAIAAAAPNGMFKPSGTWR